MIKDSIKQNLIRKYKKINICSSTLIIVTLLFLIFYITKGNVWLSIIHFLIMLFFTFDLINNFISMNKTFKSINNSDIVLAHIIEINTDNKITYSHDKNNIVSSAVVPDNSIYKIGDMIEAVSYREYTLSSSSVRTYIQKFCI